MKQYLPLKENADGFNTLAIEIQYIKDSWNCPRGYYLNVMPLTIKKHDGYTTTSFLMGKPGYRKLLKEVTRKSNKAEAEAELEANSWKDLMVDRVLNEYDLELA